MHSFQILIHWPINSWHFVLLTFLLQSNHRAFFSLFQVFQCRNVWNRRPWSKRGSEVISRKSFGEVMSFIILDPRWIKVETPTITIKSHLTQLIFWASDPFQVQALFWNFRTWLENNPWAVHWHQHHIAELWSWFITNCFARRSWCFKWDLLLRVFIIIIFKGYFSCLIFLLIIRELRHIFVNKVTFCRILHVPYLLE